MCQNTQGFTESRRNSAAVYHSTTEFDGNKNFPGYKNTLYYRSETEAYENATEWFVDGKDYDYDLNTDVHPLFTADKFPDIDYEVLLPAVRLASRLVSTDCLLGFWHATICNDAPLRMYPEGTLNEGLFYYPKLRVDDEMTASEIGDVKLALLDLASFLRFHCRDISSLGVTIASTSEPSTPTIVPEGECCGVTSEVHYNDKCYQRLYDIHQNAKQEGRSLDYAELTLHFGFAVTLVHELAHVFDMAGCASCPVGPVAENKVSESDYDWTTSVFGGITHVKLDGIVTLDDWPSPRMVYHFLRNGFPIGLVQEPTERVSVIWQVSSESVKQLFRQSFWEDEVPKRGRDALRIRRQIGYRFATLACSCKSCVNKAWNHDLLPEEMVERFGGLPNPECVALKNHPFYPAPNDVDDVNEGVPAGFFLLQDGTVVDREYADLWTPRFKTVPSAARAG